MTLKDKTITGLLWSFIDNTASAGISFIIGIVLARILSPREFGLVGMLYIFIAVSQSIMESGFSQALIRKKEPSEADYSTVFYFNVAIGLFCFLLLFFFAGLISRFFNEPQLKPLSQVLGISLVINSTIIIQRTILTKRIDFKLQTRISIIASVLSGLVGIGMALSGFGVWSLVGKTITMYSITALLLWWWNKWKPIFIFSIQSFRELFSFGSKLLISSLIFTVYQQVYYLVIGKYFSAQELGYYTRADQFSQLPSSNLTTVIQKVSFPVLASIKEDTSQMKTVYKKLIKSSMLICFILMLGMASVARPMVLILLGVKWEPCIIYLQMLCFVGMFYPLQALNLSILQIAGRSDLFLRLEIIKESLAVPVIILGIIFGIKVMILGMIAITLVAYYLNSYWSGSFIGYSFGEQIKDILPSFLMAVLMFVVMFAEGYLIPVPPFPLIVIQIITGITLILILCEGFQFKDYLYIKQIAKDKLLQQYAKS